MTIKKRFLFSYLSAILITVGSLLLIFSFISYTTLGEVPSISKIYRILTTQRPLTSEEKESYMKMNQLLQKSPQLLEEPFNNELQTLIQQIEQKQLNVVIRKNQEFTYYSSPLVEKSLHAHAPAFELNNFEPTGTIDNNGRFFHYIKNDFQYLDGSKGSFIILKRESTLFEFFIRWGIWVILIIFGIAIFAFWFISKQLSKTTIEPLMALEKSTRQLIQGKEISPFNTLTNQQSSKEVEQLQQSFQTMWLDLQAAQTEQQKIEENRKELIANISHDLKTPMTSIIGYVEGLLDGVANTPEKRAHYLQTIHEKSLTLNDLIDELFLYSKLDLEALAFSFEKVNIITYMTHLLEEGQLEGVIVVTDFPNHPLYAMIDRTQFNRVISNLIQNSLKFQHPERQLQLTMRIQQSNGIQLIFTDNGLGITQEDLPHVFERSYRSDKARSSSIKGSGLGLSIVKQIIDAHQGIIGITSQLNEETTITIHLPFAKEFYHE